MKKIKSHRDDVNLSHTVSVANDPLINYFSQLVVKHPGSIIQIKRALLLDDDKKVFEDYKKVQKETWWKELCWCRQKRKKKMVD